MANNKTLWSSEHGYLRKKKDKPTGVASLPSQQQTVYLHRESSGRGGKAVTLVKVATKYTQANSHWRVGYPLV